MSEKEFVSHYVPRMDNEDDYLDFRKEVLLWESMTALKVGARAGNLAFLLPKKAKREILDMVKFESDCELCTIF